MEPVQIFTKNCLLHIGIPEAEARDLVTMATILRQIEQRRQNEERTQTT